MAKYGFRYRSGTRQELLCHLLLLGALTLTVAVTEVSLFPRISLLGVTPDLMLCTLLCVAFRCGERTGAVGGLIGGFFKIMLTGTGFSLLPLLYVLLTYFVGHYAKSIPERGFFTYLPYFGVALLSRACVTGIEAALLYSTLKPHLLLLHTVLPELLMTGLTGLASYLPIRFYCRLLEPKKRRQR